MRKCKKNIMTNIKENKIYNLSFFEGNIFSKECVLVECGIGKVNAARTTQILIDKYDIEYVVNIGTAGGIKDDLKVTDIVIAEKLVQYDFDITAFGHEKGYITGIGKYINSDKELLEKCKDTIQVLDEEKDYNVHVGIVASGDIFCTDKNIANNIYEEFNAICVEMEGAAIAQTCLLDNIPFIVIRSISDTPSGNNNITFDEYLKISSKRGAKFLKQLLCN